ncbi:DUF4942 domain-containing protein [Aliarcobacter butzleri]|uniref:DUF4942 domain-containing protein n=1 Tax=Aliarcobacter butzleri TaxID=28197 RepID=A0AAW7PUS5_9BACT|nr:DUF4942 domain-containing protein [Aliarcobacter butzleri]MCG3705607.1 DUF4942 domain-containing protein [Aliarcobacter butzleri]MCG3710246.1 DUF4942 domain-containing protein [Aliarcobacter butzleri]MCG3714038.1 DUF4942 domain-containing protein [Aliarcobacter butzleri]MCT7555584.1 DUF4942 domain-containing protein [Aliarcobacter butzleri]MCT7633333.1 DUF4942 domain-containing protein [Aliarcobacter butzleri]
MSALKLVNELKENNEDYEFYPTTREIIETLYWDINGRKSGEECFRGHYLKISLLDIGAGNCKLFNTFKDIAESQPLLDEFVYRRIDNAEFYKECTLIKVKGLENYHTKIRCEYKHPKEGLEDRVIGFDQFMIMFENSNIENIDLSELEYTREKFDVSEKEIFLEMVENYEKPKYERSEDERLVNRIYFKEYKAIEKSQILIDNMPKEVFVIGTDFHEQTLLDKKADYIFCNPPYSEYSQWSEKIIKEATASTIYLVIPQRWGNQKNILAAIKKRDATVTVVGKFDFLESEDRKARAKVVLLKIKIDVKQSDPFKIWFDEAFKIDAPEDEYKYSFHRDYENKEKQRKETIENQIVKAGDLVSALVELYNQELNKYMRNYKLIGELDSDVLKELKVNVRDLLESLKDKIQGLKNLYWGEIFSNLKDITSRLTKKSRERLLTTLRENSNIDFTASNIRSVVIWVIKNAPKYYDNQLLEVYDNLSNAENARAYVSDKRFASDDWRYLKGVKHCLDYRIVVRGYRADWDDRNNKLSDGQMEYIQDLIVIAKNLGFNVEEYGNSFWLKHKYNITTVPNYKEPFKVGDKTLIGKIKEVYFHTNIPNENKKRVMEKDGISYVYDKDLEECFYQYKIADSYYHQNGIYNENDVLTTVVGHKNGNVHFQINQEFMKIFNLEAGRLKGWLKSPQEAAEELEISLEEATSCWKSNFTLLPKDLAIMLPHFSKLNEVKEVIPKVVKNIEDKDLESEMYLKLIKDLLEIYDDGTLYGKEGLKGSIGYSITNHFTDLTEDYKSGKYEGLSRSVIHTNSDFKRKPIGLEIYRTKFVDKTPYVRIEDSKKFVPIEDFEEFVKTNRDICLIEELSYKFRDLINSQPENSLLLNIETKNVTEKEIVEINNVEVKFKETTIFDYL